MGGWTHRHISWNSYVDIGSLKEIQCTLDIVTAWIVENLAIVNNFRFTHSLSKLLRLSVNNQNQNNETIFKRHPIRWSEENSANYFENTEEKQKSLSAASINCTVTYRFEFFSRHLTSKRTVSIKRTGLRFFQMFLLNVLYDLKIKALKH